MTSRDKKPVKPSSSRGAGGIRTLSDLNRRSGPDSESDSDEPAEYYTGGEKSGMLVQDPTKGGNGNNDLETVEQRKKNRKRSRKKKSKPEEQKPKTPAITETEIGSPSKHPKKKKGKEKEKKKSHEEDEEEVVSDYYVKMCPHMFVPRGMEEAHTLEMTKFYTSHEFMSQCKDPFYDSSDIESLSDILKYMNIVSDTDDHDTDGGKMDANYYYGKPRSKRIEALESK